MSSNELEEGLQEDAGLVRYQCDLTALDTEQRKRRTNLAEEVWSQVLESKELATGFEFRFSFNPSLLSKIAELATLEHLCCPFFDIGLKLEKNDGPLWIQITGDPGVKQYLQAEMNV